mmetsp:Transcript_9480/g.31337  ORF Transcript_9480/g.31337 Transcript_9480/m.31337 type:complete len:206 (+) Transcript_9480:1091-1708(+)
MRRRALRRPRRRDARARRAARGHVRARVVRRQGAGPHLGGGGGVVCHLRKGVERRHDLCGCCAEMALRQIRSGSCDDTGGKRSGTRARRGAGARPGVLERAARFAVGRRRRFGRVARRPRGAAAVPPALGHAAGHGLGGARGGGPGVVRRRGELLGRSTRRLGKALRRSLCRRLRHDERQGRRLSKEPGAAARGRRVFACVEPES